jgi:hypothetical protein
MTIPETETIKSLADLRPGDIMFSTIGGFVPGIFPVKAGQLMLGEHVRIGRRSFDHVGIVVGSEHPGAAMAFRAPRLVQAMPGGAEEIEMTPAKHWTDTVSYVRPPEDYPGQAADAAAIARLFVSEGVRYSFLSYGALALWKWGFKAERLAKWIDRRHAPVDPPSPWRGSGRYGMDIVLPVEAICSVLVDQCWSLAGKQVVTGTRSQIVTPGMLAMQLWNRPGVVRGGKDILW